MKKPEESDKYKIIAETNGHKWFYLEKDKMQCCRDCGIIRRQDDKNSPCRGKVKITFR